MADEEDEYDSEFYRLLETELFDNVPQPSEVTETPVTAVTTLTEQMPETDSELFADNYLCRCAWVDSDTVIDEDDSGASPSDILYDQLRHPDQKDSEEQLSEDSRFTPDSETENEYRMVPFSIRWSLGFTINSRLVNFTKDERKEFYIATAHKGIIYDYAENKMRYVHGHIKTVKAASVDKSGHWLVTGGYGRCSKIIVTDTIKCKQLLILDNKPDDLGALILGMAPDARFFISVHCLENPRIKVWKWTYGLDEPDFEYVVGSHLGKPCGVTFHPNDQNFIMIAFERKIIYCHWNETDNKLEDFFSPNLKKVGSVTDCVMAVNKHESFASTTLGYIAIFGNVLYNENYTEHNLNTDKMFVKKIKVCRTGIIQMRCPDNIIITLEEKGSLKFFDTNILLLYWIEKEIPPIAAISFSLHYSKNVLRREKMSLRIAPSLFNTRVSDDDGTTVIGDIEEDNRILFDFERLQKKNMRSKASLLHGPFICRDFIAGCKDGRIFHVDVVKNKFESWFYISDSPVASLCVSTTSPQLFVAYESGRVTIFNYENLTSVATTTVLIKKKSRRNTEETPIYNSFILASNLDVHLVVARTNGVIIFLGPTLVPFPNRHHHSTVNIDRMAFSENNHYLAFCDVAKTMFVMQYVKHEWQLCMKFRGHTEPITDMLFLHYQNPRLYTIAEDRYIVEYSLNEMDNPLKKRVKIEETAIPLCILYYPTPPNAEKFFLVANSEYKYKMIHETTLQCRSINIGPCLGCYDTPVSRMKILPNSHGKYLIFANHNHMGIQKNPPDGNPYKQCGALANPKLGNISLCPQGKYVFTYAKGEGGILIWEINRNSVDMLHYLGGQELDPYYCLIEGGANGWFFKEIEDLFCYMQILHQEDAYASQPFTDTIFISDLPDLIRACGYYPSEYDIRLLIDDIVHRDYSKTGKKRETVTFVEFVKLFLNHRPAHGISNEELQKKFDTVFNGQKVVGTKDFVKKLCTYGDVFTEETFIQCMDNLMSNELVSYDETVLDELEPITYEYFTQSMLGILQESAYTEVQEKAIREAEEDEED